MGSNRSCRWYRAASARRSRWSGPFHAARDSRTISSIACNRRSRAAREEQSAWDVDGEADWDRLHGSRDQTVSSSATRFNLMGMGRAMLDNSGIADRHHRSTRRGGQGLTQVSPGARSVAAIGAVGTGGLWPNVRWMDASMPTHGRQSTHVNV
jgi:hypothetical protein